MSDGAVITFAPFELERDHFFVFALLDNFRRHLCAGNKRIAVRQFVATALTRGKLSR